MEDDLRPEDGLHSLQVRKKMGLGRKVFIGVIVCLEPDVAEIFQISGQLMNH